MRRWRDLLLAIAGTAVLVVLWRRFGWAPLAAALEHLQPTVVLLYALLFAGMVATLSWRWHLIARACGPAPPFRRCLAGRLAGDAVGLLIPSARLAGDPVRVMLARAPATAEADTIAAVAMDRLLETFCSAVAGCVYVGVIVVQHSAAAGQAPWFVLLGFIGLLAAVTTPLIMLRLGVRPLAVLYALCARMAAAARWRWIETARASEARLMSFVRQHHAALLRALLLSAAAEAISLGAFYALFVAFGVHLSISALLMSLVATGVSRAVPAPAGVGALEAGQVTAVSLVSGQTDTAFVVAMLMRLHETAWTLIGLAVLAGSRRASSRTPSRQRARALAETEASLVAGGDKLGARRTAS